MTTREPTPHITTLELDTLALGKLSGAAEAVVRDHLTVCASCSAEHAAAAELREHFRRFVAPRRSAQRAHARPWAWLLAPLAVLTVLAAVAWLHWRPRGGSVIAVKGTAAWQVFASRGSEVFQVRDGDRLAENDRLRFVVTLSGASYLLIASIDGAGHASIYYPFEGERSAHVTGARIEVPDSIVLDGAKGPEHLYAILGDEPIASERVLASLRTVGAKGADAIRSQRALDLPARAQLSLELEKQ